MPKYYYKKYAAVQNYYMSNSKGYDRSSWIYVKAPVYKLGNYTISTENGSTYLRCDPLTGYYIEGLTPQSQTDWMHILTYYMMIASPTDVKVFCGNGYRLEDSWRDNGGHMEYEHILTPVWGRGEYMGEVVAEDGAYPANGRAADGFWYVKDRMAIEFYVRAGGIWRAAETSVRAGGAWRAADVQPRVSGVWMG